MEKTKIQKVYTNLDKWGFLLPFAYFDILSHLTRAKFHVIFFSMTDCKIYIYIYINI